MPDVAEAQPAPEVSGSSSSAPAPATPASPPEAISPDSKVHVAHYEGTAAVVRGSEPPPEAQPDTEDEGSSTRSADQPKTKTGGEPKGDRQAAEDQTPESEVDRRISKAIEAHDRRKATEAEAKRVKDAADAKEAADRAVAERTAEFVKESKRLTKLAKAGDLVAGEQLIQLQVEHYGEALDAPDETAPPPVSKEQFEQASRDAAWQAYCKTLDVDSEDADFKAVPAEQGTVGLAEVALRKTANEKLLAAALANPAAEKLILEHPAVKKLLEAEAQAARNDGLAKGIADGPKLDTGTTTGEKAMSERDLDRAYAKNPRDRTIAAQWAAKERAAGRM